MAPGEPRSRATRKSGQTAPNQPLTAHCIVNNVKVCQDISDVLSIVLMNYCQNKRHIGKPWWHYLPNCSCRREVAVPFAVHHKNFEPPTGTGTGCNRPVSRWEPFCRAWLSSRFCRLHFRVDGKTSSKRSWRYGTPLAGVISQPFLVLPQP